MLGVQALPRRVRKNRQMRGQVGGNLLRLPGWRIQIRSRRQGLLGVPVLWLGTRARKVRRIFPRNLRAMRSRLVQRQSRHLGRGLRRMQSLRRRLFQGWLRTKVARQMRALRVWDLQGELRKRFLGEVRGVRGLPCWASAQRLRPCVQGVVRRMPERNL